MIREPPETTKPAIILIDDDHGPMDYFVAALGMKGFAVTQFDSVDGVHSWLQGAPAAPHLVVVDMMMPPGEKLTLEETSNGLKTGIFVTKHVRAVYPTVPIVVLTNVKDEAIVKELPAGVETLAKFDVSPFEFAEFVKRRVTDP